MKTHSSEATIRGNARPPAQASGAVAARVDRNGKVEYFSREHYGYAQKTTGWRQTALESDDLDSLEIPAFLRHRIDGDSDATAWGTVRRAVTVITLLGALAGLAWGLWHAVAWVWGAVAQG